MVYGFSKNNKGVKRYEKDSKTDVLAGLAGLMILGTAFTTYAGEWIYDGPEDWQWWYKNDDGGYTKNDWQEIDGKWYHFDANGYLDVGQWIEDIKTRTDTIEGVGEYTYTYSEWRFVDDKGVMVTSGNWDGGGLLSDGTLFSDEVDVDKSGRVYYFRNSLLGVPPLSNEKVPGTYSDDYYYGTIGWKSEMLNEWNNKLSDYGVYGSFSMDYQLPSNWSTECPPPLMTAAIDYMCFNHWGGADIVNWRDSWRVDENNVIHIEAEYYEYQR